MVEGVSGAPAPTHPPLVGSCGHTKAPSVHLSRSHAAGTRLATWGVLNRQLFHLWFFFPPPNICMHA